MNFLLKLFCGSHFGFNVAHEMIKILDLFNEDFIIFGYDYAYQKENIKCYGFKDNFLEYLKICKGVITLGGHTTLSEVIIFKKPALVFPIINHVEQQLNAFIVENSDLALVKRLRDISSDILKRYISEFLESIDEINKRLKKVNISSGGEVEIVNSINEILKEK